MTKLQAPAGALMQDRLKALTPDQLLGMRRGIEKESLRTRPGGGLALTPHPAALGSALTHPNITTDFSESQMELVTSAASQLLCALVTSSICDSLKSVVMFGCVSAEPRAAGCGVSARPPPGRVRRLSFSIPRRMPRSWSGVSAFRRSCMSAPAGACNLVISSFPGILEFQWKVSQPGASRSRKAACLRGLVAVSYTHLRAHETDSYLVCR